MEVTEKKARNEKEWNQNPRTGRCCQAPAGRCWGQSRSETIVIREQSEKKGAQNRWTAHDLDRQHGAAWGVPLRQVGPGRIQLDGWVRPCSGQAPDSRCMDEPQQTSASTVSGCDVIGVLRVCDSVTWRPSPVSSWVPQWTESFL